MLCSQKEEEVTNQVLQILNGSIHSVHGKQVQVDADTICIHGDGPYVLPFAKCIYNKLEENRIQLLKPSFR